jgi:hypothetical protein
MASRGRTTREKVGIDKPRRESTRTSGDRVVVRGEATGTAVAEPFGARPTGRSFKTMALDVFTVRGDKLASAYHVENWAGAMQQIR